MKNLMTNMRKYTIYWFKKMKLMKTNKFKSKNYKP